MGLLSIKSFGQKEPNSDTDFSSLEVNPNYKPEGDAPTGDEPTGDEPTGDEPTGDEPTGDEPTGDEPTGDEPTGDDPNNIPAGDEPTGDEPTGSSLNNDNKPTGDEAVTDEQIFKSLSEKLDREITSFEDLTPHPVELDPQVKAIDDWSKKTGRPLEDFFKFQKDYTGVTDLDIARDYLQIEYPTLSPEEIELELEQYTTADTDLDNETAKKALALKKYATKGRQVLNELKGDLGKPLEQNYSPEIKQQLEFAKNVQEQIKTNQEVGKAYGEGITEKALTTESIKLELGKDLTLDFEISEEDRKLIPAFINNTPQWRNEDGSWNHQNVVNDSIRIKNFDKMIKLAYEQGLNFGKDDILKKAKNTTLGDSTSMQGQQNAGKKKAIIEDKDKLFANRGMTMKFGKKQ